MNSYTSLSLGAHFKECAPGSVRSMPCAMHALCAHMHGALCVANATHVHMYM